MKSKTEEPHKELPKDNRKGKMIKIRNSKRNYNIL